MKGSQHGSLDESWVIPDTFAGLFHDGQGTATIDARQITPFQQKIGMGRTIRLLLIVGPIEKIIKTSFQPIILIFNEVTSPEDTPLKGFGLFGIDGELGITAHKFTQGLPGREGFIELTQRGHPIQHRAGTLTNERLSETASCFLGSNQEGELLFNGRLQSLGWVFCTGDRFSNRRSSLSLLEYLRVTLVLHHLWFAQGRRFLNSFLLPIFKIISSSIFTDINSSTDYSMRNISC